MIVFPFYSIKIFPRRSFALTLCLCIMMTSTPSLAVGEPDSCDAAFMTRMTNRATAEAARDNVLAQATIRTADSVLEYSCFNQLALQGANIGGKLFTENTYWRGKDVNISSRDPIHSAKPPNDKVTINTYQPEGSVATAIQSVVLDALSGNNRSHIKANFGHTYLGTSDQDGGDAPLNGSGYTCSDMQIIWHVSKCDAFLSEDQFTAIGQREDIRQFPQACRGTGYEDINIEAPSDPLETQAKRLHREAPNAQSCAQQIPIETGRQVKKVISSYKPANSAGAREVIDQPEKICVLPGCYYDYNTNKCAEE